MGHERLKRLSWRFEPKVRGRVVWISKMSVAETDSGFSDGPKGIYGKHAINLEIEGGMVMGKGDMWSDFVPSSLGLKEGDKINIGFITGRVEVTEKSAPPRRGVKRR